jgi:YVTN family beta-propeller protein
MSQTAKSTLLGLVLAGALLASAPGIALAGPKAYVGNFADNTVSAIDMSTGTVVATIPVAAGPHGMAIAADGGKVYIVGDGSSSLDIIDTASDRVTKTVDVGKTPNGLALTPDGRLLLVAVAGEDKIALLDTATEVVVGDVPVAKPHTVSISADNKLAYVTSQQPGNFGLAVIDLASRSVAGTVPLDKTPRDGELAPDGKEFYFTEAGVPAVQVLDAASDKIVATISTGVSPHYVNRFANQSSGLVVVQGRGELMLFDPATNRGVRSIPVGKQPHWAALSGDGMTAYVTNEGSNDVSVVDLASGKTTTIPVGHAPRKIVVQKEEKRADASTAKISIANFAFNPGTITVRPGGSVTWSNDDGSPHAIVFTDGGGGSQSLSPGQSFTRTFDRAGTYDYACAFHPYMTGKVLVAEGNS